MGWRTALTLKEKSGYEDIKIIVVIPFIGYDSKWPDQSRHRLKKLIQNANDAVQEILDEAVCGINALQEEFDENDSEIETVACDCIGVTVAYILEWFNIPIDMEEAIRERDW